MQTHPLPIKRIPYSQARPLIQVGDGFGFRSNRIVGRLIRLWRGGVYDFSHWATCIESVTDHNRVALFEFIGSGPRRSYLSAYYAKHHGAVYWIPLSYTPPQRALIVDHSAALEEQGVKYDFWGTLGAIFRPFIPIDAQRFNCSESGWYLGVDCGRFEERHDDKGNPIAPAPGDFPVWAAATEIFELDMSA